MDTSVIQDENSNKLKNSFSIDHILSRPNRFKSNGIDIVSSESSVNDHIDKLETSLNTISHDGLTTNGLISNHSDVLCNNKNTPVPDSSWSDEHCDECSDSISEYSNRK